VVSDGPKDLPSDVSVLVGMPGANSWTLPFAHKPVFADNIQNFDLFIYSEDDIEITHESIMAFMRVQDELQPDEIAGFLRYELDGNGGRHFPDMHGCFHWVPESAQRRGVSVIAEFSNEHAACYILTQAQLKKMISSGGFLRPPEEGRHDFACTAATDPYTRCGYRKVICISNLNEFLVHHLSNRYVGQVGLALPTVQEQIQTLMNIANGIHPARTLCNVESKFRHRKWSKNYYEHPHNPIHSLLMDSAQKILIIGCGLGVNELNWKQSGAEITILPLDSIVGISSSDSSIELIFGTLAECFANLGERRFDCVLISSLLHLQADPGQFLELCARFVEVGGTLIVDGPNFCRFAIIINRLLGRGDYRNLGDYNQSGINPCSPRSLVKNLHKANLQMEIISWWQEPTIGKSRWTSFKRQMGWVTAEDWIFRARRLSSPIN